MNVESIQQLAGMIKVQLVVATACTKMAKFWKQAGELVKNKNSERGRGPGAAEAPGGVQGQRPCWGVRGATPP